jgi:protein-tyrosine phosphatase
MFTPLLWIEGPWPGHLAISARPRGGEWLEEEVVAWRQVGITAVVSLLEPEEIADLNLQDEGVESERKGIKFYSFPITDRSVPSPGAQIHAFLNKIDATLNRGENAAIHCRQGVGRAGLIATALLIEQGLTPEQAIARVSAARGVAVPETDEQRLWIDSFAASLAPKP